MCSLIHPKNWLKSQILICVLLGFGMLFITLPEQSKVTMSTLGLISIRSRSYISVALPITFRISEDLSKFKRNESNNSSTISIKTRILTLWTYQHFTLNLCSISNHVGLSNSILQGGFRPICQLLDIPPPAL
jgi:hypothetical protein